MKTKLLRRLRKRFSWVFGDKLVDPFHIKLIDHQTKKVYEHHSTEYAMDNLIGLYFGMFSEFKYERRKRIRDERKVYFQTVKKL